MDNPRTLGDVSHQHPVWILDPIGRCAQYVAEEAGLGGMLVRAVSTFEHFDTLLRFTRQEMLRQGRTDNIDNIDKLLADHPHGAKFASDLRASDFAVLNAHSLVAIWATLESAVEETAVLILMNEPIARARMFDEARQPKRCDPNDDDEENCRHLVRMWERDQHQHAPVSSVGLRFERLLSFFDLGAPLDNALAAQLAEINALRNCLMHRRGIIDERAIGEAPSLAPRLHQPITVNRLDFLRYHQVVSAYVVSLAGRIAQSNYCRPQPSA